MAYLKRFTGLMIALLLVSFLQQNNIHSQAASSIETLRESPKALVAAEQQSKNSTNIAENYYSDKLDNLGIDLRPGTEHRKDSRPTSRTSKKCKTIVYRTLAALPEAHSDQLDELTLFYTNDGRRGLGGDGSVILRCLNVTDAELSSVLTHEIGHLVDSGFLFGASDTASGFYDFDAPVSNDDPSVEFYKISWLSESQKKSNAKKMDFVSLYAMTDPFEDFAETYTYYRLHGAEFRALLLTSNLLRQKYEFMKSQVFDNKEWGNPEESQEDLNIWSRNYDVTVLPFSLSSLFKDLVDFEKAA